MNRVDAEAVDMEIAHPHQCVVAKETSDLV
jgi:hypothetical protein